MHDATPPPLTPPPSPETATLMFREAAESSEAVARMLATNAAAFAALGARLRSAPPAVVVTCAASDPGRRSGRDGRELGGEPRHAVLSAVGVRHDDGVDGDLSDDGGE